MSLEPHDSGLRPGVAYACRRALAGLRLDKFDSEGAVDLAVGESASSDIASRGIASREHVASCSFCAGRVAAVTSLAAFMAQRPVAPDAIHSSEFLDAIYQQASEEVERGALGRWVEGAKVAPPDESQLGSWQDAIADRAGGSVESAVTRRLLRSPLPQPDAQVWSGVRQSILAGVASDRVKQRKPRRWWLGFLGAAAIIVLGLLVTEGSSGHQGSGYRGSGYQDAGQPVIVFADLDRAPDVDFAIVRYGTRR